MAKVGLKTTMAMLAKGYSKKEIDALAAIDDELEKEEEEKKKEDKKDPEPQPEEKKKEEITDPEPQPDYKKMYEEEVQKRKEAEEKTKKLQQDNVHSNSAGAADEAQKKEQDELTDLVRSFM